MGFDGTIYKKDENQGSFGKSEKRSRENRKNISRTLLYKLKNCGNVMYRASGNHYIGKIQRKKEKNKKIEKFWETGRQKIKVKSFRYAS